MPFDHSQLFGSLTLTLLALFSGYLMLLRLREHFLEKPDPKTTYATIVEVDKLRAQLFQLQRDTKADFSNVHALIYKNAEHIARIIAQNEGSQQRINELNVKTDRLNEKQYARAASASA